MSKIVWVPKVIFGNGLFVKFAAIPSPGDAMRFAEKKAESCDDVLYVAIERKLIEEAA